VISFLKILVVAVVALVLGLLASRYTLSRASPFDRVRLGAWELEGHAGSTGADPYTRARLARSAEIPLALGEGLQWIARTDDAGRALDPRCVYEVGPRVPAARYWTLSVVDPRGFPVPNALERYGFRSSEVLRSSNGDFIVTVAAQPQSGNWLPVGSSGSFALALRLYDAPLGATPGAIDAAAAPSVTRTRCG